MSFLNISQKFEKVMGKEVELLEAARTGNLQTVEKILSSGKGRKSHHVGGALGQKLSSFLKSVNVNYTDKNGYTALHHAAVNGFRDVVEVLLKADAQPGHLDNQGCTPVHLAAWNGDAEIVMQLLTAETDSEDANPVNVNQQNGTGDTALHCAAQYGHVAVVDVLLQKTANPTIRNLNEASPLDLASQYGRLEVVQRLLISHPELARHPSSTQSPLHLASRNGHRDIVAVLLDNNFDIQTMTETGNALHEAALHGKLDVVKLLLERGIDVNQRDYKGQTVLELLSAHQAQQKSFTEITRAIQEHMKQSGSGQADLYESLSSCRSGSDKPTAAVKPLPPEKPSPSDRPRPPDKPHPTGSDEESTPERPVPTPRLSVYQVSPDGEPERISTVPMYSKPNKEKLDMDRAVSSASSTADDAPPPLPPRTSIFASEERHSPQLIEPSVPSIPETTPPSSKANIQKPKKPPRQKRSPAPVRKSPPTTQDPVSTSSSTPEKTDTNIPDLNVNIPPAQTVHNDSADCENTSQHSMQDVNQSHSTTSGTDQSDCSISHSTHTSPPVKSPRPKTAVTKEDNSVDTQTGRPLSQGFYMEMSKVNQSGQSTRPVSEVKPQVKVSNNSASIQLQAPSQQGVDNYGILFPNLKKSSPKSKPEFRRMNTAPCVMEDVYVKPHPKSPTEQFKEKQGLLQRANTAPEESTYLPMNNTTEGDDGKDETLKENEYSEIPEKDGSLSPSSPKENVYATITETDPTAQGTTLEVDTNEYSQIKDLSPTPSPRRSRETQEEKRDDGKENIEEEKNVEETVKDSRDKRKENSDDREAEEEIKDSGETQEGNVQKGSPKPTHLDFLKSKPGTPLTPTGYPQPPTPDFPPPSPATAMLGIEMKIQQIKQEYYHLMDSKRKSRDITTLTDDTLGCIQEQRSEVKSAEENSKVKVTETVPEVKVTAEENSKVKVTETVSEVKVTAEVKDTGVKPEFGEIIEESESKVNKVSSDSDTKTSEITDVQVTPNINTKAELTEKESDTKLDISEESNSVIKSETKDIPKSSIPETVIETEKHTMSKNKPPVPKKPDLKPRSVKIKDQEDNAKNSAGEGGGSPVVMRRKTSTPDMDVFKGLLRGSTIGNPCKERSKFYNEVLRHSQARNQEPPPLKPAMDKEEDIDIDQVMESIDAEVVKRASATESTTFDDSEEWEKIADIMSSFGGNLTSFTSPSHTQSEEEFNVAFEAYMDSLLTKRERGSGQMISIGEWLESLALGHYENAFVANGYDNIDFLDSNILEEQDLEQIGVLTHGHRQKILQATKNLPLLKPIDPEDLPPSVEEWLMSLQLPDYLETFTSHGYDTMEKVQSILWELQLRTVLDISTLGHRKRILASLGERKPIDRHTPTQKKRSLSSLSPEDRSPFNNIDLFKDYTNVKPVSSSEEDIKESSQMAIDSSEDDDVFKKKTTGQSIRNSNIHVRPPHMAQTSSPAKQWRHKPEMLIKGCCNYTAQYLGSTVVPELTAGTESTRAGITKLKKSTDILAKIPVIMLSISYKGVKFIDAKSKKVICDHEIGNIFCACQDTDNLNFFAYITRDIETGQHYCHVFSVKSSSLAHDIILTLGESFEVAYQMALKEKSNEEAMELDHKMSQSDAEDTYSTVSKMSTNTV
ncbi:ankyrin repeat and sterile alpha motif domain-containing protein 1B-like isoform X2 [Mercenaria mercenaria]|uniref:ankyrin repeat and sterile alpha motif domain-containing protein 1B-like isoform X2 n=1 Tax=Mercenaria mercenaria TaxID=6596 RepID=UPI00234F3308|nr:ankyrin repeat and sterile alpha motif domain-containing protein 1B-like isoform X2 [Mercenaria mercenaria]